MTLKDAFSIAHLTDPNWHLECRLEPSCDIRSSRRFFILAV
jgi:hypothetical protein